jgi:hypothetical protein
MEDAYNTSEASIIRSKERNNKSNMDKEDDTRRQRLSIQSHGRRRLWCAITERHDHITSNHPYLPTVSAYLYAAQGRCTVL